MFSPGTNFVYTGDSFSIIRTMIPFKAVAQDSKHQEDQAHEHEKKLNVSKGQLLEFTANGNRITGVIVKSSESSDPQYVECLVRCAQTVPAKAQFLISSIPKLGACGRAQGSTNVISLAIGCAYIDSSTIGK